MLGRTNTGGGGGGAGLNFKVVGNPCPEAPAENTVWIDTDTEITSWIFSATQPEVAAEGMVWFSTGIPCTAPFNALKKNGIIVYPLSAKQYVNGAWVGKTAKTYQNGAWVDWWNGELYYLGNEYKEITGGWEARAWRSYSWGGIGVAPTLTKGEQYMEASFTMYKDYNNNNGTTSGAVCIVEEIDLTDVSTITVDLGMIECAWAESSYYLRVGAYVVKKSATYFDDNKTASAVLDIKVAGTRHNDKLIIDVSGVTGFYNIAIGMAQQQYNGNCTHKMRISKVDID